MSKAVRKRLIETIELLIQGTQTVYGLSGKKDIVQQIGLLTDCQELAIAIGTQIENLYSRGTSTVSVLESYCEMLYQYGERLQQGKKDVSSSELAELAEKVKEKFLEEFPNKKTVVFLPYKASMWDSLESIWKKAEADPDCDAYVIPIPYYDRKPDGSLGQMHYEGEFYPKDVPIVSYLEYDLEKHHPDEIYIHNPYDEYNIVTSVEPSFYSRKIKNYTDNLVYVPYYVLAEPDPEDEQCVEDISHLILVPAVLNADHVIVQSEAMRKVYIKVLTATKGKETKEQWEKKILGTGSPKFDNLVNKKIYDEDIPKEWRKYIFRSDGSRKKIVLYNTSVTTLLNNSEQYLKKLQEVLATFQEYEKDLVLLWRPHPLMLATIASMRPELEVQYQTIMDRYRKAGWGIYDDTSDLHRAIALSDAYYGDVSSVVQLCEKAEMPVLLQNISFHV